MKRLNKLSIKLCIFSSLLIIVIISAMAHLIMQESKNSLISQFRLRSDSFARAVREALYPKLDIFSIHLQVKDIAKEKAVKEVVVLDATGKILSHSFAKNKIGEIDMTPQSTKARDSSFPVFETYKNSNNIVSYFISQPVFVGNQRMATVIIILDENTLDAALAVTKNKILIISALSLLLAIAGTILIVNYVIRFIPILAKAALEVGKGNLEIELVPRSSDEIGQLSIAFNQMVMGLREKEHIRSIFGKYLSKEIVEILLKEKSLSLGGERRKIAVLFADIRDFTVLSSKYQPEEIVKFLNTYFSYMSKIIHSNGGIIDKYIGDGLLALFGVPIPMKNASAKAISSAIEMKNSLALFNEERNKSGYESIKIGICVTSGLAVIGNIGSEERMEYTAIGEPVNLAARLEGLNKRLGTNIIIPAITFEETKEIFRFKNLGAHKIRGWESEVEVYEVEDIKNIIS